MEDEVDPVFAPLRPEIPIAAAAALAEAVAATLRMARALVGNDRRIDLTGLDREVGLLCARCLDLPPADGARLRPVLLRLLGELGALETALRPRPD